MASTRLEAGALAVDVGSAAPADFLAPAPDPQALKSTSSIATMAPTAPRLSLRAMTESIPLKSAEMYGFDGPERRRCRDWHGPARINGRHIAQTSDLTRASVASSGTCTSRQRLRAAWIVSLGHAATCLTCP